MARLHATPLPPPQQNSKNWCWARAVWQALSVLAQRLQHGVAAEMPQYAPHS
jgi:hypothetical protein